MHNTERASHNHLQFHAAHKALLKALLAVCLTTFAPLSFAETAHADVRKADKIAGSTVEQRNLTVADSPSVEAEYAALMDSKGNVYFERNAGEPAQIASITKVMTAVVTLDHADSNLQVIVTPDAAAVGESSAGLQEGDELDLDAALKALLVPSGNDAAIALAETVGAQLWAANESGAKGAVDAFVKEMNAKAAQIGCTDTIYENPHGLDDGEFAGDLHSTALDQLKVAQCAMTYPEIRSIVAGGSTSIQVKRQGKRETVDLETTDALLESYDAAIGIKTGMTDLAGPCFMGAANKDDVELYAVVLDSADESERFTDAKLMFMWYYDHVKKLALANSEEWSSMRQNGVNSDVPVVAEVSHADWLDRTVEATLEDPSEEIEVFDLDGNVSQSLEFNELHGTINVGDTVGKIMYYQHNNVIAERKLVACEKVDAPNPLDTISITWQRFIGGFSGQPSQATSQIYNVMPIIDNNKTNAA